VRVVIQHKTSFHYVRSDSDWTNDALKARDFERIQAAADFCRKHNLREAYIVSGDFHLNANGCNPAPRSIFDIADFR
jgi:hypothetical protein